MEGAAFLRAAGIMALAVLGAAVVLALAPPDALRTAAEGAAAPSSLGGSPLPPSAAAVQAAPQPGGGRPHPPANDTDPPAVALLSPPDGHTEQASNTIVFIYVAEDNASGITSCSLFLNAVFQQVEGSVLEGVPQNFTQTLRNGPYNWSVSCTDDSPNRNVGASPGFSLTVDVLPTVPAIVAGDGTGRPRNQFLAGDGIVAFGTGFPPGYAIKLFVTANSDTWNQGDPLVDLSPTGPETVVVPPDGSFLVTVWAGSGEADAGYYDLVADVAANNVYDQGADPVDSLSAIGFRIGTLFPADNSGLERDVFFTNDTVRAEAAGLPPSAITAFYVVEEGSTGPGAALADASGGAEAAATTPAGGGSAAVWTQVNDDDGGLYDLVADNDGNGMYNDDEDLLVSLTEVGFSIRTARSQHDAQQDTQVFSPQEDVFVRADGLPPSQVVTAYVIEEALFLPDQSVLEDRTPDGPDTLATDPAGTIAAATLWTGLAIADVGPYDIVIDADQDGLYDALEEPVDNLTGPGFRVQAMNATNLAGEAREAFPINEPVYATGGGFPPGIRLDLYVVQDGAVTSGSPLSDETEEVERDVQVSAAGEFGPLKVWENPERDHAGFYDMVADVDQDGVYDRTKDALVLVGDAAFRIHFVEGSDGAGATREAFQPEEPMFLRAEGLPPNSLADVYVVENTLQPGAALQDVTPNGPEIGAVVGGGGILGPIEVWQDLQRMDAGLYDIVVDVNRDALFQKENDSAANLTGVGVRVATITVTDAAGSPQHIFFPGSMEVFFKAEGFPPGKDVAFVAVDDLDGWVEGALIVPLHDAIVNSVADRDGKIAVTPIIRGLNSEHAGIYDMVADVDMDGVYSLRTDAVERNDGAAFRVPKIRAILATGEEPDSDRFVIHDTILAEGKGLPKNSQVTYYVIRKEDGLVNGQSLVDRSGDEVGTPDIAATDTAGTHPLLPVWTDLKARHWGDHWLVVDTNNDGLFNSSEDAVDTFGNLCSYKRELSGEDNTQNGVLYSSAVRPNYVPDHDSFEGIGCIFYDDPRAPLDWCLGSEVEGADLPPGITPFVRLNVYDVDNAAYPVPEQDQIFLNGQSIGYLTGVNNQVTEWVTEVSPSLLKEGNNIFEVDIDQLSQGGSHRWCTYVTQAQIKIPGLEDGDAEFTAAKTDKPEACHGDNLVASYTITTKSLDPQNLKVTVNLIDKYTHAFLDAESNLHPGVTQGSMVSGSVALTIPSVLEHPGSLFDVQFILIDTDSGSLQNIYWPVPMVRLHSLGQPAIEALESKSKHIELQGTAKIEDSVADYNTKCTGTPTYSWTFGDGMGASGKQVSHDYEYSDRYTITLTTAALGATSTSSIQRTIGTDPIITSVESLYAGTFLDGPDLDNYFDVYADWNDNSGQNVEARQLEFTVNNGEPVIVDAEDQPTWLPSGTATFDMGGDFQAGGPNELRIVAIKTVDGEPQRSRPFTLNPSVIERSEWFLLPFVTVNRERRNPYDNVVDYQSKFTFPGGTQGDHFANMFPSISWIPFLNGKNGFTFAYNIGTSFKSNGDGSVFGGLKVGKEKKVFVPYQIIQLPESIVQFQFIDFLIIDNEVLLAFFEGIGTRFGGPIIDMRPKTQKKEVFDVSIRGTSTAQGQRLFLDKAEVAVTLPILQHPPIEWPFLVPPVPVPVRLGFKSGIGAQGKLTLGEGPGSPGIFGLEWQDFSVGPTAKGEVLLSAGANYAVEVTGSGGLKTTFNIGLFPEIEVGEVVATFFMRLTATALFLEMDMFGGEWTTVLNNPSSIFPPPSNFSVSGWRSISRSYLDPQYHTFGSGQLGSQAGTGTTESLLVANVFPQADPAMDAWGDEKIVLWTYDDPQKSLTQSFEILASHGSGSSFFPPVLLTSNMVPDAKPAVQFLANGDIIAAWVAVANESLSLNASLGELFGPMEIHASLYDHLAGSWSVPAPLTANSYLDYLPSLAADEGGNAMLVWMANEENVLPLLNMTSPERAAFTVDLMWRLWNGTGWQPEAVAVANASTFERPQLDLFNATEGMLVWEGDTDGNVSTLADKEVFFSRWNGMQWMAPVQVTADTMESRSPRVAYGGDGAPVIFWVDSDVPLTVNFTYELLTNESSTFITESRNLTFLQHMYAARWLPNGMFGLPQLVAATPMAAQLEAKQDATGNIVLLWQGMSVENDTTGTDIFSAVWDEAHGVWSLPVPLTHDTPVERSFTAAFDSSNTLFLAYLKTDVSAVNVTIETGVGPVNVTIPEFGANHLYVLSHSFSVDAAVYAEDISFSPAAPAPGEIATIAVAVRNEGDMAIDNLSVDILDGIGGPMIGSVTLPLLSGGTLAEVAVNWTVPDSLPHAITVIADPANAIGELNESNNQAVLPALLPDITVPVITARPIDNLLGSQRYILLNATVRNAGSSAAYNVTVEFYLSNTSTLIPFPAAFNLGVIPLLPAGGEASITRILDIATTALPEGYYYVIVVADPDGQLPETDEGNNQNHVLVAFRPDLTIDPYDLRFSPLSYLTREQVNVTLSVVVTNRGNMNASDAAVSVFHGSPTMTREVNETVNGSSVLVNRTSYNLSALLFTKILPLIRANRQASFSRNVSAGWGYHEFAVVLDLNDTIAELDEGNNIASAPLAVPRNGEPVIVSNVTGPLVWPEDSPLAVNLSGRFADPENGTLTYGFVPHPSFTATSNGTMVTLLPGPDVFGTFAIQFTADDGLGTTPSNPVAAIVIGEPDVLLIECRESGKWEPCAAIGYADTLEAVQAVCINEESPIAAVSFTLRNVEDNMILLAGEGAVIGNDTFVLDHPDILIQDSGTFLLDVGCSDARNGSVVRADSWSVPFGRLEAEVLQPAANRTVALNQSFAFSSLVRCVGGECGNVTATLDPSRVLFMDDMESGMNGWVATGFWHLTLENSSYNSYRSPLHSWWYGLESTGTFSNGTRNAGELMSPQIDLSRATNASLSFWYWYQTEGTGTIYDQRRVYVRNEGGPWVFLGQLYGDPMATWLNRTFSLDPWAGQRVQVRFFFDSMDAVGNGYRGWYIDDVAVSGVTNEKGAVPMGSGRPFFTTDQNPVNASHQACLAAMQGGAACTQAWTVTAAGDAGESFDFFTLYDPVAYPVVGSLETPHLNITVIPLANNTPPSFGGLPELNATEDAGFLDNLLYLPDYAQDNETPSSQLFYSILSETSPQVVDCEIDPSLYLDCTTQPEQSGSSEVTIQASDGEFQANDTLAFTVTPVNDPPALGQIGNREVNETQLLEIQLAASDPENDTLTFGTNAPDILPSPPSFDPQTGLFQWTPTLN
ncbi:MAG: hypothetical protein HY520_01895, partial [Candidatus Aenigmarchaeota archaeon]|nr:hypothetical protein [Candidatus Aenigmarchaeota archaeon]